MPAGEQSKQTSPFHVSSENVVLHRDSSVLHATCYVHQHHTTAAQLANASLYEPVAAVRGVHAQLVVEHCARSHAKRHRYLFPNPHPIAS